MSSRLVLQHPSRKNPVKGFIEQSSSRSPRTFLGAFGRPPPFPLSSLSIADLWTAATSPVPATAGRRQWAPALVLGRAGDRRGDRVRQAPVIASASTDWGFLARRLFARLARSPSHHSLKCLAGLDQNRLVARRRLIAAQNDVNVERIELDAAAGAPSLVGCDEGRAGAQERV